MPPPEPFWSIPSFWLYAVAWLMFTGCLLAYGLRSPWQASATGRAMFTLYASMTAILTLVIAILTGLVSDGPLRDFLRTITLGGVAIAGAVQLVTILRLQRRRNGQPH